MPQNIFQLESRGEGATVIWMNDSGPSVNTLKQEMITEFEVLLSNFEQDTETRTLVFASAKPDNFIVGADLDMIRRVERAEVARTLSETLQTLHDRIEKLRPVTVAAIHGSCLGGGLELALAFDLRVASADPITRLGLPEVQLGLLPAGGGTQRLPIRIGAAAALDLILTGKRLSAQRAYSAGLVDEVVAREHLIEAAIKCAGEIHRGRPRQQWGTKFQRVGNWVLSGNALGRKILFDQAARRAFAKTRGNYPATDKIIEVIRTGLEQGREQGLAAEAVAFGGLVVSPESRQLVNIFFASNALKKENGIDDSGIKPATVKKVGVLGAGLMGAGITSVTIDRAQIPVRLKDKDTDGLSRGLAYVNNLLSARLGRRSITPLQFEHILARVTATTDYSGFGNCTVVIEAVYENLELKQRMLQEVENTSGPGQDLIFASNTSAIPISKIADGSRNPERVIGMHYFSPVEKMPLLEIVVTNHTAPWVVATCVALGRNQGKTVIVVNDGPGFYTTRVLAPYMSEATRLLAEGVAIDRVDEALLKFGFPIGPMALLDEVGIDVGNKVARTLFEAFGDRMKPVDGMQRLVDDQRQGKKNKKGLYLYGNRKKSRAQKADSTVYRLLNVEPNNMMTYGAIAERCVLQLVNEAAHCLGEGILKSPRDGDIGSVLGLGFPPFLGGPFRYLDASGCTVIRARLEALAEQYGDRFAPAPVIMQDKKFYN